MAATRTRGFDRLMDASELNARDDAHVRTIIHATLVAVAVPAGLGFGFVAFASAMWANIAADGAVDATATDLVGEVLPGVLLFGMPAVVVSLLAWRHQVRAARLVLGGCAALPMMMLTAHFGFVALAGAGAVSAAVRSLHRRGWAAPAADATALLAGFTLIALWCVLEAAR